MNETIEGMLAHRSIRKFTDEPVAMGDLRLAVRAGQAAATSSAVQAYCAIRVTDPSVRREIAELSGPQEKIAACAEFLVICADSRRHRLLCARAGKRYDQRLEAFLVGAIDAALFAQNMVLAFESMGYGTCYIGGIRNDLPRLDKALSLPKGVYPMFGLCVGRPAERPSERPRLPVDAILFEGAYPSDERVLSGADAYDETYRAYLRQRGARPAQVERSWSGAMVAKFEHVSRPGLGAYYAGKGAKLD